jgi:hypothetical protein
MATSSPPESLPAFLARVLPGKRLTLAAIERRWLKFEQQRVHATGGLPPRTEQIRRKILRALEALVERGDVQHHCLDLSPKHGRGGPRRNIWTMPPNTIPTAPPAGPAAAATAAAASAPRRRSLASSRRACSRDARSSVVACWAASAVLCSSTTRSRSCCTADLHRPTEQQERQTDRQTGGRTRTHTHTHTHSSDATLLLCPRLLCGGSCNRCVRSGGDRARDNSRAGQGTGCLPAHGVVAGLAGLAGLSWLTAPPLSQLSSLTPVSRARPGPPPAGRPACAACSPTAPPIAAAPPMRRRRHEIHHGMISATRAQASTPAQRASPGTSQPPSTRGAELQANGLGYPPPPPHIYISTPHATAAAAAAAATPSAAAVRFKHAHLLRFGRVLERPELTLQLPELALHSLGLGLAHLRACPSLVALLRCTAEHHSRRPPQRDVSAAAAAAAAACAAALQPVLPCARRPCAS